MKSTRTRLGCAKPSKRMDAFTCWRSQHMWVWTQQPQVQEPQKQTGGRPRRAARLARGAPKAGFVCEVAETDTRNTYGPTSYPAPFHLVLPSKSVDGAPILVPEPFAGLPGLRW